ncbi:hypothetical protein WSM22_21240 [Cytophagales bacterium WSM2-2]|nr:hypothetical protein WSM22_21240 [Cytophagales bacterium WSM2-2]
MNSNSPSFYRAAFGAGLVIGVLDGTAACVSAYLRRSVTPEAVFKYVAGGVFGKDAFTGGTDIALWGLLFHFTIAMAWTVLFFVAFKKVSILSMNKFLVGFGYGLFVWLAMTFIVVPLSNLPSVPVKLVPALIGIGIHMFVIGMPISLMANNFFSKHPNKAPL